MRVQVPLLTPLTPAQKAQLCAVLQPVRNCPAGTSLVRRGELGDAFYIVEAGSCVVLGADGRVRGACWPRVTGRFFKGPGCHAGTGMQLPGHCRCSFNRADWLMWWPSCMTNSTCIHVPTLTKT